jgi:polyisoprenoid-binding protein YceI
MKHRTLTIAATCIALLHGAVPAQRVSAPAVREYLVDYGHSIVEFSVGFALSRVKGRFTNGKGTVLYDEKRPEDSSVSMVIESKSIDTGWPHRDEHLRTADFFDVDKFPTIVFQSDRLVPNGAGWVAQGKLSMHGVTRDVAIPFKLLQKPMRNPLSNWLIMNLTGELRVARADFGILGGSTYNSWFSKARAATVADSVDIALEVEAYSADAVSQRSQGVEDVLQRIRTSGVQSQIDRLQEARKARPAAQFAGLVGGVDLIMRGLIAAGAVPDALTLGRAGTEMFPDATRAAAVYALALSISGDASGAAREYARMKQIFKPAVVDPNEKFPQVDENWYYLDLLAANALEMGYAKQALPLARTIAELYPQTARAHTTLGNVLAANSDAKGAAAEYAKALEMDPRETRALEWRRRLR